LLHYHYHIPLAIAITNTLIKLITFQDTYSNRLPLLSPPRISNASPTPPNPLPSVFDDEVVVVVALAVVDESLLVGEVVVVPVNEKVKSESVMDVAVSDVATEDGVEVGALAVVESTDG
jgi:hypothetical protein